MENILEWVSIRILRFGMWTGNAAEKEGVGNEYSVKIVSNSWT